MKRKKTQRRARQSYSYRIDYTLRFGGNSFFFTSDNVSDEKESKVNEKFYKTITDATFKMPLDNLALFMTKYIPIIEAKLIDLKKEKEKVLFSIDEKSISAESIKPFLSGFIQKSFKINNNILQLVNQRVKDTINVLTKNGYISLYQNIGLNLITQSRLVVGLGAVHPLEISLALHHIFGVPYIPGSALKGVSRMVAFWKIAKEKGLLEDTSGREDKIKSLQNRFYGSLVKDDEIVLKYQILFGAQNFKGLLLFLDAYPEVPQDGSLFDLDVMNIHYPKYYSGNEPPGDWQNPNPIFFLTIKEGINFNFHVLFDQYRYTQLSHDYRELINQSQLVSEVKEILEYALKEFGIGAKTRLGYGLFE